jgi:DNA-binding NarL/FixJ family response regulator
MHKIPQRPVAVIAATGNLAEGLATIAEFRLASMRLAEADVILRGPLRLRCLIVDDNAPFRAASRLLLEREGLHVVGVATSAETCLERAGKLRPDVVLLDVELGDESGFEVAARLADALGSTPRVIFISTHPGHDYTDLVRDSGAAGFLSKSELSREAIERLLSGGVVRSP